MLFPLIESCLPESLLRVWQRTPMFISTSGSHSGSQNPLNNIGDTLEDRLHCLMNFLRVEVENEQRITLASEGFGLRSISAQKNSGREVGQKKGSISDLFNPEIHTAAGLINYDVAKCIFCDNPHESTKCFKAQKLSLEKKKEILNAKRACYRCLKIGHLSRKCRGHLRCTVCQKWHVTLMCPDLTAHKDKSETPNVIDKQNQCENGQQTLFDSVSCTQVNSTHVFLQTLRVKLSGATGSRYVRALIDTGSQNTYILKTTAQLLGYRSKREHKIVHCLFGGTMSEHNHECYDVKVDFGKYNCTLEALSQPVICTDIPPLFPGPWVEQLNSLHIKLSDGYDPSPIELLIGSDVAGKLYTGRRHVLACGLVAVETLLGWTLMGRIPLDKPRSMTMTAVSLFVKDAPLTRLWQLDVLGITDPAEQKSREQLALAANNLFLETIQVNVEGRYEVCLPWLEGHPPLPSNYVLAKRRMENAVKKLKTDGILESYSQVFEEWINEGILERVSAECSSEEAHYLPHRPVIKNESATTKIRPVFDASASEKGSPSLNQCLEKGLNLIELIPVIFLRFRQNKLGVVADIRKAFLQISFCNNDRDFLRFLWIDSAGSVITYRHKRVVFGISSSPFLLGATIDYHLSQALNNCDTNKSYSKETVLKLSKSFYVDNCVTSVTDEVKLKCFITESTLLMAEGMFDLRGWEFSHQVKSAYDCQPTALLGLLWDTSRDTLRISEACFKDLDHILTEPVTKRAMLSLAQRVFDPIGFTCPATLLPKLLLQKTWEEKIGWDTKVKGDIEESFRTWIKELRFLLEIEIPRWINAGVGEAEQWTIHTFCDASKNAYAAVVFLRGIRDGKVFLHLLAAKSRVAPLNKITIPRLELLAAVIGSRLFTFIIKGLELDVKSFFWSDSSTVISWIRRPEEWGTFVHNRISEIRQATSSKTWHFVPGAMNPADLPSRGCSPKQLLDSKWWEWPKWLYENPDLWPSEDDIALADEVAICLERRKRLVTSLLNSELEMTTENWHMTYFSNYFKTVRMVAWIFRFFHNARKPMEKAKGELLMEEISKAEMFVLKVVQRESFGDEDDKRIRSLSPFKDECGVIRLKSRVSRRNDDENFCFPIVLPARHPVVNSLIFHTHLKSCHVRTQGLMSILRNNYWILGGRRAIKSAINKCVICKRQNSKSFEAESPPLPLDRVREAVAFEITGVDFAGPLYLRGGDKIWICLFTCAIYRAVHFELCSSLSVANFMQALRRFIARRGRPRTMYSDNGTNFVGTESAFNKLDWQQIAANSCVERIIWRFNPPTASWWGGFWESIKTAIA